MQKADCSHNRVAHSLKEEVLGIMAEVIRADAAVLAVKAKEISERTENLERTIKLAGELIRGTKSFWNGDAGGMHQRKYEAAEAQLQKAVRSLKRYPAELAEIAGRYERSETENTEDIMALAGVGQASGPGSAYRAARTPGRS